MTSRTKIIAIVGGIILLILGGLLYWAYQKQNQSKTVSQLQVKKIVDEPIISPVASFDNNAIWYFNDEGRLFRINSDGTGLSEYPLPAINGTFKSALWPKDGEDFLAISTNGTLQYKSFYDSSNKLYINLPVNVQSIEWMPDAKRVAYIWRSSDATKQSLVVADADGSGFKTIKDVFWSDLVVRVSPDGKKALLYRPNIEGDTNKIYLVDLDTGEISTAIETGKNLDARWISADKFLYSQAYTAYPKIYLFDFASKTSKDLGLITNLDKTLVDKDAKILFASIPKKDNSGDTFVKMNLSDFQLQTYFEPEMGTRGTNLMLVGNTLYFINSRDSKLYSIQ